ncbi:lamin tail domain-containing protein 1 [Sturnira hondurensis]|uniref:lamin tail domain-containing protein 1 n=1 Tax=Sturnira hondurensis TaxID=192404 RepID=UPI001879499E|nr:lamin tail domain-containing protein 1 [Sturnira hondurensis]
MKDIQGTHDASAALRSQVPEQEEKTEKKTQREDAHADLSRAQQSSVHFLPGFIHSDSTTLSLLWSSSSEMPPRHSPPGHPIGGVTAAPKSSKSTLLSHFQSETNLGVNRFIVPKKKTQTLSTQASELAVTGDGEDYFLSLFGDSKKLTTHSFHTSRSWKHFSMILEEVGHCRSSAFGDIKIVEVKDLYVKLTNSSIDKEIEIGNHILQQNVNGQAVSLFRFPPNTVMHATSTVTVWTAASKANHQPPSDFLWKEENKFSTSPNCTTILCKPNGEAIAWYTPIHWKQAWEKLENDIEFEGCSIVSPTSQRHVFHWPKATTTTQGKHDQSNKHILNRQIEPVPQFLKREKEVPPTLFPSRSPWCDSPNTPAHPYCPLIEPHDANTAGCSLPGPRRPQPGPILPCSHPKSDGAWKWGLWGELEFDGVTRELALPSFPLTITALKRAPKRGHKAKRSSLKELGFGLPKLSLTKGRRRPERLPRAQGLECSQVQATPDAAAAPRKPPHVPAAGPAASVGCGGGAPGRGRSLVEQSGSALERGYGGQSEAASAMTHALRARSIYRSYLKSPWESPRLGWAVARWLRVCCC